MHLGRGLNVLPHGGKVPRGTYKPYFQNRVGEVQRNLQTLAAQVETVELPLKIAGLENPADIGTRGRATLEDIGPSSL